VGHFRLARTAIGSKQEVIMQRRDFLISGVGGLLATGVSVQSVTAQEKPKVEIIDTHTHFYDPTRPEGVPWPSKDNKRLYRTVLPDEFKRLARPLGVVGTVVVEASAWVEDNQWLLDLAEKEPLLVGIVGRLDTASDDFEKHLRRFARNPLYRGLRIGHGELKAGLTETGKLVDRCKLLIDHNLELDVNGGPDMPADVARLAAELPKLRIVINHCANLRIDGREPPANWREAMQAAARHPNVFCKVSALVEHTAETPAPRDVDYYLPVLDTLWTLFGEDRLVYGSNWPVSDGGAPLETVVGIVRDYFTTKGEQAAGKFFHGNSQTAYAWRKR
jgi:L-fuconolactonase